MQKFSSNVVERCLKESSEDQATQIVKELVSSPDLLKLLQDAFGNYVVQSALQVSAKVGILLHFICILIALSNPTIFMFVSADPVIFCCG